MEKISGIIPPSPRTKTADVAVAQPARPGALALGRPMGKNSLGDRITLSKLAEEMRMAGQALEQPMPEQSPVYKSNPEAKKLKVIEELNQKFFQNPKSVAREGNLTKSEEALTKTTDNEGLFYVEKELRPEVSPPPLKEISDNKVG